MFEGHAPSTVFRFSAYLGAFQLLLLLIGAGLFLLLPDLASLKAIFDAIRLT